VSALADLAAALLPPEHGGPQPHRVAATARRLLDAMPPSQRYGIGAALASLELYALARDRRPLGRLAPARRAELLRRLAGSGSLAAASVDGLKTLVLLAAGADQFATEVAATANRRAPSRPDPELRLVAGAELPETVTCDAIVVGSGAGGAFAGRELARAGLDVVIVEEGERWDSRRIREAHPADRFAGMYRGAGATVAIGTPPIALPLGRGVGGTTLINSGTCYRPPESVVRAWAHVHGLALADPDSLEARLGDAERTVSVAPAPMDILGRNGELALAGAEALGWTAAPLRRNAPGCQGACQCAIGCPNNAKGGVHLNALPQACEAGARIATGLRAFRIESEDGRAIGIEARAAGERRVRLRAPLVVAACGAIETPPLLRRSGVGRHLRLGRNLSIHPALGVAGAFAEPVFAWRGVMQSVGVEELHEREGVLLEATSTPPGMGAMAIPGFGAELLERLERAEHSASVGAMIADEPSGRVLGSRHPTVLYRLARADRRRLRLAAEACGRVLLAAGAEEVELGAGTPPVRDPAALRDAAASIDIRRLRLAGFHPTGTAAAGSDPARHPVDPHGRLRGITGVWIADASILPSCPGVNPQISIMALAAGVGAAAATA
jgi:choline dehydrogenase-like flavoprotein